MSFGKVPRMIFIISVDQGADWQRALFAFQPAAKGEHLLDDMRAALGAHLDGGDDSLALRAVSSRRSIGTDIMIGERMLFRSCATPLASVPMLSNNRMRSVSLWWWSVVGTKLGRCAFLRKKRRPERVWR
jgi:hypothetical protein